MPLEDIEKVQIMGIEENNEEEDEFLDELEDSEDDDIQDIGRARRIYKKRGSKRPTRKEKKRIVDHSGSSKLRKDVISKISLLPKKTQKAIFARDKQISDKTLYSVVSAADSDKLIRTDAGTSEGKTNIDNGKYSNDFVVQKLQILYEPTNDYLNSKWNAELPAQITNGNLSITCDSKTILSELPLVGLPNYGDDNREYNTFVLDNSKWFFANKDITAYLKKIATIPGYIRINFIGQEIRTL